MEEGTEVKVSRAQVFEDDPVSENENQDYQKPQGFDFEIVDVEDDIGEENTEKPTETELFPLFSVDPTAKQDETSLFTKVTLVEDDEAKDDRNEANVQRPDSHYFAQESEEAHRQFEQAAISGDEVISQSKIISFSNYKLVSLTDLNAIIAKTPKPIRAQIRRNQRPSKKQRLGKKEARERLESYKKEMKNIQERVLLRQKLEQKKGKPKKPTRRGGRKHKKPVTHDEQSTHDSLRSS